MLPLRYIRGWRIAGVLMLVAALAATLMPALGMFGGLDVHRLFEFDKWAHGVMFAILALWFSGQYARRTYWRIAFGLLVFGGLIELCQLALSYRTGDFADFTANAAGILAGLAVALAGLGGWSLRVESWLTARREQG